ncbi:extracellular solute-binding protein [Candidatus Gottesmanbacteria bacterium]|nr:extracellular solute-binding protein [Candidatus Gottesmanbacteria bacterium]
MDNLKKEDESSDKTADTTASSGEIFSNPLESSYQEAVSAPVEDASRSQEDLRSEQPPEQEEESSQLQPEPSGESPSDTIPPPPPFEENKKRKVLLFLIAGIVLVVALFFIVRLLFQSKPAPKEVTLTYWGLWEGKEVIQPILDDYKKAHPNVTINYVNEDPKQYRERVEAAIARNEGPDIFRFHNTWVPMFVEELDPVPKTIYSDGEFTSIFFPIAASDLKVNGNFYGIPLEIDGLMLFYNEDILKNANVSVPTTWVDVQNVAPRLTVKENERIVTAGIALGGAENIGHFSDILALMMLQNGVNLHTSLFSCADSQVKSCATEALTFYHRFIEAPNNTWDGILENSIVAFARGNAAIIFAPSWQIDAIRAINPNLNFKTAKVPQLPCSSQNCPQVNWASYWVEGVSSKSRNKDEAWQFLKYLSSPEVMTKYYGLQIQVRQVLGEPYSRVDLANTLKDNMLLAPLLEMAPTMKSFPLASRTEDGETGLNTSLIKYMKDAVNSLSQGVSPETALQTADNGFQQVFSRFNISSAIQ